MNVEFYKFDGAGNDFVVIDNRAGLLHLGPAEIARICHRRYGVGADGLMTLDAAAPGLDFTMRYYNADGLPGTMCGNGGRCIAAFAHLLGMGQQLHFGACDGIHTAEILEWDSQARRGTVRLSMRDVPGSDIRRCLEGWFIDTGSPHYVQYVDGLESYDVVGQGRRIRHLADTFPQGTNVDFIEQQPDGTLAVRTYERGVEDETWACGTGVTACAIVTGQHHIAMRGGTFTVDYHLSDNTYTGVRLTGPASLNYTGVWTSSAA